MKALVEMNQKVHTITASMRTVVALCGSLTLIPDVMRFAICISRGDGNLDWVTIWSRLFPDSCVSINLEAPHSDLIEILLVDAKSYIVGTKYDSDD
jgi:hypothetical protein